MQLYGYCNYLGLESRMCMKKSPSMKIKKHKDAGYYTCAIAKEYLLIYIFTV